MSLSGAVSILESVRYGLWKITASNLRLKTPRNVVEKPVKPPPNQSLTSPVVESPGPVAQSSDLPPPPPRRYHSHTSDTELIAPTRQVRCTIVQGPNRKFRPDVLTRGDMGILEVKQLQAVERDGA